MTGFYRIQGILLCVPPLRERRADIAPLLNRFLSERPPTLSRAAKALLMRYDWPGNVRELRNVVETLCLLRGGRPVRTSDLPASIASQSAAVPPALQPPTGTSLTVNLNDGLDELTRQIVVAALELDAGNKIRAAARLRISLRTVQRYVASGQLNDGAGAASCPK